MGTKSWKDIRAMVPETPERSARVAAARVELAAQQRAYNLTELRRLLSDITQEDLARELGMNQSAVSKTERADDMSISRLRTMVDALGGTLTLVATFNHQPVVLAIGSDPDETDVPSWWPTRTLAVS